MRRTHIELLRTIQIPKRRQALSKRLPADTYRNQHVWLIIGRELSYSEIEEFDLEYIGERLSYESVQSEIKRLSMQGNH